MTRTISSSPSRLSPHYRKYTNKSFQQSDSRYVQLTSSRFFFKSCYAEPEGYGALKLAGVDQGEDQHGVYDHRHPEVLQDPSPPLKMHLDIKKKTCLLWFLKGYELRDTENEIKRGGRLCLI